MIGDEIVAGEDIYGGSDRLLSQVVPRTGAIVTLVITLKLLFLDLSNHKFLIYQIWIWRRVDTTNLDEVAAAIGPQTKLVWLESPTNPRIQISDIRVSSNIMLSFPPIWLALYVWNDGFLFQKIAEIAHANGALVLVDNSIMSPVLSRPLELGAGA